MVNILRVIQDNRLLSSEKFRISVLALFVVFLSVRTFLILIPWDSSSQGQIKISSTEGRFNISLSTVDKSERVLDSQSIINRRNDSLTGLRESGVFQEIKEFELLNDASDHNYGWMSSPSYTVFNGEKDIDGPIAMLQTIINPILLMTIEPRFPEAILSEIPEEAWAGESWSPIAVEVRLDKKLEQLEITYNVSEWFGKLQGLYPSAELNLIDFNLHAFNAFVLGLNIASIEGFNNVDIDEGIVHRALGISGLAGFNPELLCSSKKGCNSFEINEFLLPSNIRFLDLPASLKIKLWRHAPKDVEGKEDLRLVMNFR